MKPSLLALALSLVVVPVAACGKKEPDKSGTPAAPADGARFDVAVTEKGFEPDDVAVPAGRPVTLIFHRETEATCAKQVVLELDGKKIEKELPLHQQVEVAVTFAKAGKLTYACGMDMVHGAADRSRRPRARAATHL